MGDNSRTWKRKGCWEMSMRRRNGWGIVDERMTGSLDSSRGLEECRLAS